MLFGTHYVRTSAAPDLDQSLTAVCLGSSVECILITCDIHRAFWLVSVYGELKWLSGGTLRQADLLSTPTTSHVFQNCLRAALDMSGTSHLWSRSRRGKVLGLGPSQKYFGHGLGTTLPISRQHPIPQGELFFFSYSTAGRIRCSLKKLTKIHYKLSP
jgi:hypothetical protein